MAYYFFIDDIMLPVPPPKMSLKVHNKNKTVTLINEGEINIIKKPGLSEISFDVLLPNQYYPFSNYDATLRSAAMTEVFGTSFAFRKASFYLDLFERLKTFKNPFRLIITRMSPRFELLFSTNLLVTLESYSIEESAQDGFDVIVPLRFKQYRPYSTKELEVTEDENGQLKAVVKPVRMDTQSIPETYTVTKEQSIWEAVKRASGGSLSVKDIMNLNKLSDPTDVFDGMVLSLG